ncbi:hypothetical protein Lbys_2602 [Leadbetterella byssophila DSM 17132]|uniref:DUF4374 domain-containing protein n=1 Tax=Leadbetterella byssophila (strain DSM 17132 / JCM 16389 / KACC 11308 / NBRC 106382 / 4M15) TaxID=649349 RepID=E4RZM1_LEAB4|nr:hypothetical protein [Leadbetterella byssophila]ADQ18264.1 hypothetical protein Lbys_2602 [Leadbetterella byssophila DSM 17132]
MMKKIQLRSLFLMSILGASILTSCEENTADPQKEEEGKGREFITLTASIPDEAGTAGNGGTMAFALTPEQAIDPSYVLNIYQNGFGLRSARTARVQASEDGTELYNIQYTGEDGGVFNKYRVNGGKNFIDTGNELVLSDIIGTSPRWVKAAEGIGIGVHLTGASTVYDGTAPNHVYKYTRGTVRIAIIDLINSRVPNTAEFAFPFPEELEAQGYYVGRIDVPVLNAEKTKIYIGCNVSKYDPKKLSYNAEGKPTWANDNANRQIGTTTLVVDYPSLTNPKLIYSEVSKVNNHSYRTMTQYVGTDGHIYQATATSGQDILRISKNTNTYDNSYHFSLDAALGVTGARIQAFRYIKDGEAVVLYNIAGKGGYIALVNLNTKTATKISNEYESSLDFSQYQNIAVHEDLVYIPLTPSGESGKLYVINWKTKTVTKGATLSGQSGSWFIGSY